MPVAASEIETIRIFLLSETDNEKPQAKIP